MPHISHADLSHAFCSYCGYPPMGRWRDCAHRVCMRCQMGVVLRAPEGAEPGHDDPFLIVDRELAVQAVSRNAELVLSVDEPASLGVPLEQFLICCNGGRARGELARLVEAAFAGVQPSSTLELLSAANRELRLEVRVTSCGAPPGALLILHPLATHATASSNGRPHANLATPGPQPVDGQLARNEATEVAAAGPNGAAPSRSATSAAGCLIC